jgi:hypothetical protein
VNGYNQYPHVNSDHRFNAVRPGSLPASRRAMDLFADPAARDTASPFLQFLWERGAAHEDQVVAGILPEVEIAQ